jgi:hypothetical protein
MTNERTGHRVRVVWSNEVDGEPERHGFDALVDETLDLLRASHRLRKDERDGVPMISAVAQRRAPLSSSLRQQPCGGRGSKICGRSRRGADTTMAFRLASSTCPYSSLRPELGGA